MIRTWVCSKVKPTNYLGTTNQSQNRKTSEKARSTCPITSQRLNFVQVFGSLAEGSESNTNLAMHLGAIAQWISILHAWVSAISYKCYALRFGFWGTLGNSSGRRVTVFGLPSDTERHTWQITWQKKTKYSFLWVGADLCSGRFSCCFHGKYHYDST